MDELEQLIEAFSPQPAAPVYRRLDVLLDLEQLRDCRAVRLLQQVLQNRPQPLEVRMRVIRLLAVAHDEALGPSARSLLAQLQLR